MSALCAAVVSLCLSPGYATADEAAHAAISFTLPLATRYEYGGAIVQCEDKFHFTEPMTSHSRDSLDLAVRTPATCTLVATFHTHQRSHRPSPADLAMTKRLRVTLYIGVVKDRSIVKELP